MRFALTRVRERGLPIPKHQQAFKPRPVGRLNITEAYVPELHRHTLLATLCDEQGKPIPDVPALYDARLLRWTSDVTLTGIEHLPDELTGTRYADHAQTWHLEPLPVDGDSPDQAGRTAD